MAENSPKEYFRTKKRYVQVGHLGRGGMAIVSESKDEYFQRNIAYKKLKAGPNLAKRTEEFVREALIMGKLEHPGILPVHELIEEQEDTAAITMDKVVGLSLAEKITQTRKDPASWPFFDRIKTFQKLVEIVAYSHSRHIVHRDIKPANVMLGEKGNVILLDWGLAKVSQAKEGKFSKGWDAKILDSAQSISGSIKGTPYYMSPEAAQGRSELVKEASDVFGLGAVLYELITLNYLIEGTKAIEVLKNAAEGVYRPVTKEALEQDKKCEEKNLPIEIVYILEKSLKKEIKERYQNGTEMNADLLSLLNFQPIVACGGPFSFYQINKGIRKHAMTFILVGLPLLGIVFMSNQMRAKKGLEEDNLVEMDVVLQKKNKKLNGTKMELEKLIKKNLNESEEIKKLMMSIPELEDKNRELVNSNSLLQYEILDFIDESDSLENQDQLLLSLEEEVKELEERKKSLQQSKNLQQQEADYQEFLKNTIPYGVEIANSREQFESGRSLVGLQTLKKEILKVDPYVVGWMQKYYKSVIKQGAGIDQLLHRNKKSKSEVLNWLKEGEVYEHINKKMSSLFPYKKWVKFLKEKGLLLAFAEDGSVMNITGEPVALYPHVDVPQEIRINSAGTIFGYYGDHRFFTMKNISAEPKLVFAQDEFKNYELIEDWLVIQSEKSPPIAFKVGEPELEWKSLKTVGEDVKERDKMSNTPSQAINLNAANDFYGFNTFPPGYRLLNNTITDGPWLIAFINVLKSKFRNHIPNRGNKEVLWTIDNFDPLAIHDDGAMGWVMLGKNGRLFSFRPDQNPREMLPIQLPLTRLLALKKINLAFAQDANNKIYVYYLNTGQYLFSPGVVPAAIDEVMLDGQNRVLFHLATGEWVYQLE
jgi:serine/threonine protein kinase